MNSMSGADVSRAGPRRPAADPPAIRATAPRTGNSASAPGNADDAVSRNADAMTTASPAQPSHPWRASARVSRAGARARMPPAPSSHMRVAVIRYAAGAFAFAS